MQDQQRPSSLA